MTPTVTASLDARRSGPRPLVPRRTWESGPTARRTDVGSGNWTTENWAERPEKGISRQEVVARASQRPSRGSVEPDRGGLITTQRGRCAEAHLGCPCRGDEAIHE